MPGITVGYGPLCLETGSNMGGHHQPCVRAQTKKIFVHACLLAAQAERKKDELGWVWSVSCEFEIDSKLVDTRVSSHSHVRTAVFGSCVNFCRRVFARAAARHTSIAGAILQQYV